MLGYFADTSLKYVSEIFLSAGWRVNNPISLLVGIMPIKFSIAKKLF